MKFKFLAMAAAVAATATSAGAADLNKPAKAAVDYVKVCDAYGAGFFYIPGSDTCLKIGGRVYFDVRTGTGAYNRIAGSTTANTIATNSRTFTPFYTRDAIYFNLDARSNTEFGLLRSFEELRVRYTTNQSAAGPEIDLTYGYVQWGGFTAGKARSFYDFTPAGYTMGFDYVAYQTNTLLNTVGYTANFGNGVTGTIALQDSTTADGTYNMILRNEGTALNAAFTTDNYGGNQMPDVVANLNVTQAWGSAQISGVLHQDYSASAAVGSKMGYAIDAGAEFKLDQIAKGDKVAVNGGYSVGGVGYITPFDSGAGTIGKSFRPGNYIGEDWAVDGGAMRQTKAWGVVGSFEHNFNPNFLVDVDLSYVGVNGYNNRSESTTTAAATLKWIPTADRNFYIGFEAEYGSINYTSATKTAYAAAAPTGGYGTLANASGAEFGIRVNRGF